MKYFVLKFAISGIDGIRSAYTFITYTITDRLISVEDVRNYLSHIIYILIFDFFLNFLLFVRLQTPT